MEAIIAIVGFLGAGKTTLLKRLVKQSLDNGWNPFVILNDYENANMDVQQFLEDIDPQLIKAMTGSCICCSGINELRDVVNNLPERKNGITLIEANGTSDACSLMGFLGVGVNDRFLPPVQISVVDVKNWQKRDEHNELEANQIQVSSLIILTHTEDAGEERLNFVTQDIAKLNPLAQVLTIEELDIELLPKLSPSKNEVLELDHLKTHWSSCSMDLPPLLDEKCIHDICDHLPKSILRIKGCTKLGSNAHYTYFERTPDGTINIRDFKGEPTTGSKLLTIGVGSNNETLQKAILAGLAGSESRM